MRTLREMVWIIAMPCTQATRIISDSLDAPQRLHLRIALRVHVAVCRACRRYRQQLLALRRALRELGDGAEESGDTEALPSDVRERIRRALEQRS